MSTMTAKISRPGVYRLTMEQYHGQCTVGPSISSSGLRTIFIKSPAHYWKSSSLNPKAVEDDADESQAFILGRASHHLLLGESAFSTLFVMRPEELGGKPWHGNRTECKAWITKQRNAGRTVLTPNQIEQIRGMAHALAKNNLVNAGILNGTIEQSLLWKDAKTGVWLKSRPDAIPNDCGDVADLKTTIETGFNLDSSVSKHAYDMQAAMTKWALKEVLNIEMESFSFVFVEKNPPHCVDVLTLAKEDIALAEHDLRMAVRTFAHCLKTGDWFGPSGSQNDARFVYIPDYVKERRTLRREFLAREIAPPKIAEEYSGADYLAAG